MEELRRQRDMAQAEVDELRRKLQEEQQVFFHSECSSFLFFLFLLKFLLLSL